MMNQFQLILLISVVASGDCRRLIWKQRTNLVDAHNWEGDRVPCASDTLQFPSSSPDLIKLSNFTTKELILPKSGGFLLDTETSLNFREADSACKANDTKLYKSVIQTPWLSSSNWLSGRDINGNGNAAAMMEWSDAINAATPHEERVPCDNDEIIFPINNSYVVDLQSIPVLSFKSIAIDGEILSVNAFKDFLLSTFGQAAFKNTDNTLFVESPCNDDDKCVCHHKTDALRQQLCSNLATECRQTQPHCSDPIRPIGHCCDECGAMFHMKIDNINAFDMKTFKSSVEGAIKATSVIDLDQVVHHISIVSKSKQLYLQLIIVDRFDYDEHSTKLMLYLQQTLLDQAYGSQSKFYYAGIPFTPNQSGHVLAFIFGTLFMVTLFMAVIYAVYYDDRHIPRLMAMMRNRQFLGQSDVIFARFDTTTMNVNDECADSVAEVDLHFGTDQSIENINSAFNNPMFDQNIHHHPSPPQQQQLCNVDEPATTLTSTAARDRKTKSCDEVELRDN